MVLHQQLQRTGGRKKEQRCRQRGVDEKRSFEKKKRLLRPKKTIASKELLQSKKISIQNVYAMLVRPCQLQLVDVGAFALEHNDHQEGNLIPRRAQIPRTVTTSFRNVYAYIVFGESEIARDPRPNRYEPFGSLNVLLLLFFIVFFGYSIKFQYICCSCL